jgi:hypothetical protein
MMDGSVPSPYYALCSVKCLLKSSKGQAQSVEMGLEIEQCFQIWLGQQVIKTPLIVLIYLLADMHRALPEQVALHLSQD